MSAIERNDELQCPPVNVNSEVLQESRVPCVIAEDALTIRAWSVCFVAPITESQSYQIDTIASFDIGPA